MSWISVIDRLPEGGKVLICFKKPLFGVPLDEIECAYFDAPEDYENPSDAGGWLYWRDDKPVCYPVTHWQPLPEPPKDD